MRKNTISLSMFDGCEGCEYIIHGNGDVYITTISNGSIDSEVDVDIESLGFKRAEDLVVDLISQGYNIEW